MTARDDLLAELEAERFTNHGRPRIAPVIDVGRLPADPVAAVELLRELDDAAEDRRLARIAAAAPPETDPED